VLATRAQICEEYPEYLESPVYRTSTCPYGCLHCGIEIPISPFPVTSF